MRRLGALMRERGIDNILLIIGGVIPEEDHGFSGSRASGIFGQGTSMTEIVAFIRSHLRS